MAVTAEWRQAADLMAAGRREACLRQAAAALRAADPPGADQSAERLVARLVVRLGADQEALADLAALCHLVVPRADLEAAARQVLEG